MELRRKPYVKRLRGLESENARLKRLLAECDLEGAHLRQFTYASAAARSGPSTSPSSLGYLAPEEYAVMHPTGAA